jgi:hypothetical protein
MLSNTLIQRRADTLEKKLECMYFSLGEEDHENELKCRDSKEQTNSSTKSSSPGTESIRSGRTWTRGKKISKSMVTKTKRDYGRSQNLKEHRRMRGRPKILQNNKKAAKYSPEDLKNRNKTI